MDRLIETRHVAAANYREVTVPGSQQQRDDPTRWLFLPCTSGGSISLPAAAAAGRGQPGSQLLWQLQNHTTSTLSLAEVSLSSGQVGRGVHLHIPGQVFSAVAHFVDSSSCYLFLLLSSKSMGMLKLPLLAAGSGAAGAATQRTARQAGSILDSLQQHSLVQLPLAQQLAGLGIPTAIAAADGHLCVAGSSGSVLALPLQALAAGGTHGLLELSPSNLLSQVRRRMGFAATSSVVAAVPVDLPRRGHQSLLVLHEDASCHQWFVGAARQGFSSNLAPDAAGLQLRPNRVLLCPASSQQGRAAAWDALLVWDMGLADSSGQSDVRVMPFSLQAAPGSASAAGGGGGGGPSRLEPQLPQPLQLQLEWPDASLLDACIARQQLLLLCRTKSGGTFAARYSCRDWSYQGRCQLLQQRGSADWGMQQELWSAALAACPESITPAGHVLSQLMVPGQLCVASLEQALRFYDARVSQQELVAAPLQQLQAIVSGTVERIAARFPSYSPARCWHNLFSTYCDIWQQQHGLLGLFTGPGGWVGLVRAGGLLTVLRKQSPAEVLLQETNHAALEEALQAAGAAGAASGIAYGVSSVAKVQLCLTTLGGVLGEPAQRVWTQLVMAGVPVEGELLPRFVELLLQGPPVLQLQGSAAAAAAGGGSYAATQQQQQRLSEWRMLRQKQLLAVQEQLAELPHPLETLSGVAELIIKAATAAASQLQLQESLPAAAAQGPAVATGQLVCGIALHTTRASCMALQQLLLLLGCLRHMGSIGTTQLTAADQAAIATDLIPPLATALRSAAVALWLCKTPASSAVAGTASDAAGISDAAAAGAALGPLLQAGSAAAAGTPRGTPRFGAGGFALSAPPAAAATVPCWHFPLAGHLLPDFWRQPQAQAALDTPGASLHTLGSTLAAWLLLGAGAEPPPGSPADADGFAAATQPAELAGRAVLLGYRLFVFREYGAMRRLVSLVGGATPSEAGLQFILGLSIACGIRGASRRPGVEASEASGPGGSLGQDPAASALLGSAVGHLFRAAAGFCGEDAAALRQVLAALRQQQRREGSGGGVAAAAAAPLLHTPADMDTGEEEEEDYAGETPQQQGGKAGKTAETAGGEQQGGEGGQMSPREARLRLEFCEAVMLLFERERVTEGALAFARAALGVVDAAFPRQQQQAKEQQQAKLWTHVFNFSCELGQHSDAYAAALANPLPAQAAEAVGRLVQSLLERGQLGQLLALPWAGTLLLAMDKEENELCEHVPVVQLVISRLVKRALHCRDPTVSPAPHQVLFDFLVAWGSYKAAAAAMLGLARQLRAHAAAGKAPQQRLAQLAGDVSAAYDACLAMLQLLDPSDAWLDPQQPLLVDLPAPPPGASTNSSSSSSSAAAAAGGAAVGQGVVVLSLESVKQEAALFGASVLLQQQLPGLDIMAYDRLTADYVFEQLLGSCQFPAALQLAHALWAGEQRATRLEALAAALAGSCVRLQASQGGEGMLDGPGSWEGSEGGAGAGVQQAVMSFGGPGYLGSAAAGPWEKLRRLLGMYDADGSGSSLVDGGFGSLVEGGGVLLGGRLRLAAVDGALSARPDLSLPPWLLAPFKPAAGQAGGMAGCGADPAGLLRAFIRHGRLLDAAQLLAEHLEAWQRAGPLLRCAGGAVWLPLKDAELLHASLAAGAARLAGLGGREGQAEELGTWGEVLEAGVADHLALARSDADKLTAARGGGAAGAGGMGMAF